MSNLANVVITSISLLSEANNDRSWVIRGKVLLKQEVSLKSGKFYHFDLYDGTARIRVLVFDDAGDIYYRFNDVITVNNVYRLWNATLRPVSIDLPKTTGHQFEVKVDSETFIEPCNEIEPAQVPKYNYNFVPFEEIGGLELKTCIAIVGFVVSIGPKQKKTDNKRGYERNHELRTITLVNKEGRTLEMKVWNTQMDKFNNYNDYIFERDVALIVAANLAQVGEFNGTRHVSPVLCSQLIVNDTSFDKNTLFDDTLDNVMDTVREWRGN